MVGEVDLRDRFAHPPVLDMVRVLQHAPQPGLLEFRLRQAGKDRLDIRLALVIEEHRRNPAIHRGVQLVVRPSPSTP
ncbi:MAG: hypothetical protein ERJ69_04065 [Aphanocapsa feldmannii 288cV]|nr:MAG: hypothetical protein ERJ69_04065 [Aphanocapsa feldmannii 288cV]